MEEMKRIYRQALPSRIAELEAALEIRSVDAAAAAIRRVAHSLRGSGGTYGFPAVTAAAAAVEDAPPQELRPRLDALIAVLRETALADDRERE